MTPSSLCALVVVVTAAAALAVATPGLAVADTHAFVVNSVGDGGDLDPGDGRCDAGLGECTLRAAIEEANADPGADRVHFAVEGGGPHVISPREALPAIVHPLIIDGTTQAGFGQLFKPIILDGSLAPQGTDGLRVALLGEAADPTLRTTIRGLTIQGFASGAGIRIGPDGPPDPRGVIVEGNFIGTTEDGFDVVPNGWGIYIDNVPANLIGGLAPDAGNVIAGNRNAVANAPDAQIFIRQSDGNQVLGNRIGTNVDGEPLPIGPGNFVGINIEDASDNQIGAAEAGNRIAGDAASPHEDAGVAIESIGRVSTGNRIQGNDIRDLHFGVRLRGADNHIGGLLPGERNVISNALRAGVLVEAGGVVPDDGNAILGNRIFSDRGGLSIDLGFDGPTPNDEGDADAGPNDLQNYPDIAAAVLHETGNPGLVVDVEGLLDSHTGDRSFRLEFFVSRTGLGEAEVFLGAVVVNPADGGVFSASFDVTDLYSDGFPAGYDVTATATELAADLTPRSTSEVSLGQPIVDGRDRDGDGILDAGDNCPDDQNPDQADTDGDGLGNLCDPDDDNDGVADGADACPLDAPEQGWDADLTGCTDTLDGLVAIVGGLDVDQNARNGLLHKLSDAEKLLVKGKLTPAINKLYDFIDQVEAKRGTRLTDAEADLLVAYASNVIASLGG